ncbi:MAG: hypothetical protein QGG01_07125, partial [Roseibacillus sp.]|nr:hypothetical protein [Roseibacillus sp.]
MKKEIEMMKRMRAILATLPIAAIFALTAATSFAADNQTLSWEFGDGQVHGWQIVSGEVGFYDGGMASTTWETRD